MITNPEPALALRELVEAIDDGRTVDWEAFERAAGDTDMRALVRGYQLLAGVAAIARNPDDAGASAPPVPSRRTLDVDLSGKAWGPFLLEQVVGRGAFSTVYRADDPLGRPVAVKLLGPRVEHAELRARVLNEGRLLASVRHDNIVVVHGVDQHDDRVGLWMELVQGCTLASDVEGRGPHSADEAVVIGRALCGALAAVHAKGLVHGDVKAHNVMRETGGRVVLMDFGAGQSMHPVPGGIDTLAGTPLYLCPERLAGAPASAATDIYSLGVLLYHLVTGRYPVEGASRADVEAAHAAGHRTRLRDRRPDLPPAFIDVVERAIHPDPASRFATAGDFEDALSRATAPPVASPRRRPSLALGLAAVGVLGLGTAIALWQLTPPAAPLTAVPAATPPVVNPTRYTVQAAFRQVAGDKAATRILTPGARVAPDAEIELEIEISRDAHVYVVNEDEAGRAYVLFPGRSPKATKNPLVGGRKHVLPDDAPWKVDSVGGREHLYVIVSPTALPDIEAAMAVLPGTDDAEPAPEGSVAGSMRGLGARGRPRPAAPAATERPWKQAARPLTAEAEQVEGAWIRELLLENPPGPK